jgi:DNA-binding MarR family transcriptional regulator
MVPPAPIATAPGVAVADVLDAFGRLLVAQRRLRGRDAREAGELSYAQMRLMSVIDDDAACPVSQLAEQAGITAGSATAMLGLLEHKGLVTRRRSDADRRVTLTVLTDRGRSLRDAKRDAARAVFADALRGLAAEELAAAPRVLAVIADVIESL